MSASNRSRLQRWNRDLPGLGRAGAAAWRTPSAPPSATPPPRSGSSPTSVMANSRNSRPTTSPMNSSGISTAISEMVSEMMVKPICSEPLSAASSGGSPCLDVARDVLDHHDRVVDDEARGDGQRHQRQVVEAEAQEVHGAERADQRQRHRQARDEGRPRAAQEDEDHQHHQHHGERQLELDIVRPRRGW